MDVNATTIVRVCTITEPDPDGLMESDSDDDYDYMECDDPLASSMDAPQSTSVLMEHDCDMALVDGGIITSSEDVAIRVLTEQEPNVEHEVLVRNAVSTIRWCVDSGANRDICKDLQLFNGQAKPGSRTYVCLQS